MPALPAVNACEGRRSGDPARLPVKPPKKAKPERTGRAFWIERDDHVWIVRREGEGMLGGMAALPDDGWSARQDGSGDAPVEGEWASLGAVRHVFTHASLTLEVLRLESSQQPEGSGQWWPISDIESAGLPTLFAKAARLALAQRA